MNSRRNPLLPGRDGKLSRRAIILSLATVLLLNVGGRCGALDLPNAPYNLTRVVCEDKLSEWNDSQMKQSESPSDRSADSPPSAIQPNGAFMRGTWRQAPTSSSVRSDDVVRAPFLSSGEGVFDFFSAQWMAVVAEVGQFPAIQNISGQLFFTDARDHGARTGSMFQVHGLYNSNAGEICLLGCVQAPLTSESEPENAHKPEMTNTTITSSEFPQFGPVFGEDTTGCIVGGLMTISTSSKAGRKRSHGVLESLKAQTEEGYFTVVELLGSMVDKKYQNALYHFDVLVRSLIFSVEAGVVGWQIVYTSRSSSGHLVSILMILIQVVVMVFLSVQLIYIPIHLLTYQRFKYLISTVAVVPWLVFVVVILLNVGFFWLVLSKRRGSYHRMMIGDEDGKFKGLAMAAVCMVVYTVTGVVFWAVQNFDTYLQVVWCWFLLPQLVANAFWDVRGDEPPLHWAYVVGVSGCRVVYIGFNAVRPTVYGYDDLNLFPYGWFWGITGTVVLFASYALLQQRYGGSSLLPQSWFGYQQLDSSPEDSKEGEIKAENPFAL